MLTRNAKCFAAAFHEETFLGGTGWLQRLNNCYGTVGKAVSGEREAASNREIEKRLSEKLPEICVRFSPADIFSVDETGLFLANTAKQDPRSARQHVTAGR